VKKLLVIAITGMFLAVLPAHAQKAEEGCVQIGQLDVSPKYDYLHFSLENCTNQSEMAVVAADYGGYDVEYLRGGEYMESLIRNARNRQFRAWTCLSSADGQRVPWDNKSNSYPTFKSNKKDVTCKAR
jgi:hypothetical protein